VLTIEESESPALRRYVLAYGEALRIDNTDRQHYNHYFLVQNESDREVEGAAYDFLITNPQGVIFDFGMNAFGAHLLPINRHAIIAPREGVTLSVAIPEILPQLRTRSAAPPLHHMTIAPSHSVAFHNRTDSDIVLANNSANTRAGFHWHGPGEMVLIDAHFSPPLWGYVPMPPVDVHNDTPESGGITIPANTRITITAALGEDLEIWFPRTWARSLGVR